MDNEKIDIVMNKLNDIKSASLDYSAETIEQMVTDFKITGAITRDQFKVLINAIDEIYFPVIEDEFLEEEEI